jgi:hypothetical protein
MNITAFTTATDFQNDQADQDYVRDSGTLAIYCSGHYTVAELEYKIAALREAIVASTYSPVPK